MNKNETILDDSIEPAEQVHYAGFWQRVFASLLDGLILSPVTVGLTFFSLIYLKSFVISLLPAVIGMLYKVWMEKSYGATLGKQIMGIRVCDNSFQAITYSQSFIRNYYYLLSILLGLFQNIEIFNMESFQSADTFMKVIEVQQTQNSFVSLISRSAGILFLVDCLFMLNDGAKRTLHDRWAKTIVVRK